MEGKGDGKTTQREEGGLLIIGGGWQVGRKRRRRGGGRRRRRFVEKKLSPPFEMSHFSECASFFSAFFSVGGAKLFLLRATFEWEKVTFEWFDGYERSWSLGGKKRPPIHPIPRLLPTNE